MPLADTVWSTGTCWLGQSIVRHAAEHACVTETVNLEKLSALNWAIFKNPEPEKDSVRLFFKIQYTYVFCNSVSKLCLKNWHYLVWVIMRGAVIAQSVQWLGYGLDDPEFKLWQGKESVSSPKPKLTSSCILISGCNSLSITMNEPYRKAFSTQEKMHILAQMDSNKKHKLHCLPH